MTDLAAAALFYARHLGWRVFPIWPTDGARCACPLGETCTSAGKHPLADLVPRGQAQASADPAVVAAWWEARPDASVAVSLHDSGLFAFDVDLYKDDQTRLAAICQRVGALPPTAEQRSGSGQGVHLLYRAPSFPVRGSVDGVTTRARNYIVLAPSRHRSGAAYAWEPGCAPWEVAIAALPPAWLEELRRPEPSGAAGVPPETAEPPWLRSISNADRLAAARAHLARETGERKGIDPPGTAWHVARTCARGYAVREPGALLDAIVEIYDPKCDPPYGRARCAERVEKAYTGATEPAWGWCLRQAEVDADLAFLNDPLPETPTPTGAPPPAPVVAPHLRGAQISAWVQARSVVPFLSLCCDSREVVSVRSGGIVLLIGGSGAGKSSLAATMLLDHAAMRGPAIAVSLELPADEMGARMIGIERGATWADVLRGQCADLTLPDRLVIVERRSATVEGVCALVQSLHTEFPGQPILVAWDYAQLMPSGERDVRQRVADAMRRIDAAARETDHVAIALSQGSRASARALGTGEKVGAETTDAGAEAAELERWSTITLAIGEAKEESEGGPKQVSLSVGKSRMGSGDMVLPMRYDGRSGRWSVTGAPVRADKVREQQGAKKDAERSGALLRLIVTVLEGATRPLARAEVAKILERRKADVSAVIAEAVADQGSGIVEVNFLQGGARPVWTRAKADAAGMLGSKRAEGMPAPVEA